MKLGTLALLAIGGCTADVPVLDVSIDEPLPAELRAGDVVHAGDVAVVVPDPGETVYLAVERDDGSTYDLAIENPIDGVVRVAPPGASDSAPPIVAFAAPNPCSDGAFHLEGFHWASDFAWKFHASSTPSGLSAANVETGLRVAANAITNERNSCGLADRVSATNSYGGHTSAAPGISSTATCTKHDGHNVIGFGALPAGVLGLTCAWSSGGVAIEADVKLSTRYHWFSQGVPASCSNRWGVEQVATHELGHVYGLAHVSQSKHPELTMSTAAFPCRNDKLTLGLGDVRGLRQLY